MFGFAAIGELPIAGLPTAATGSYTLTASAGAFTLTGVAANLLVGRRLVSDVGTFSLTGQAANLLAGRILVCDAGSFSLSGQNATLIYTPVGAYTLIADAGSFTLSGQAASLLAGRKLTSDVGTFSLSGQSANLLSGRLLTASVGTFTLSGQAATLTYVPFGGAYTLTAATGAFLLNGQAANLIGPSRGVQIRTDLLIEPYSRRAFDSSNDTDALVAFLIEELRRVENTLKDVSGGSVQVADREPTNKRRGMVRYAVNPWNPGGGDGLYVYTGTAWTLIS